MFRQSRSGAHRLRLAALAVLLLGFVPLRVGGRPPDQGDPPTPAPPAPSATLHPSPRSEVPDPILGSQLYRASCAECHGTAAEGLKSRGPALRASPFVRRRGDAALLEFLRKGRSPGDADHRGPERMPGRGGNIFLPDPKLLDIVAYLRRIQ